MTAIQEMSAKADELAALHAAIAELKNKADKLRACLEDAGLTEIEGALFTVRFSKCNGSKRTDWKAVAEKLKPSKQLVTAHTSITEACTRMTIKARS